MRFFTIIPRDQRECAATGREYRKSACWVRLNKNKAKRVTTITTTTALELLLRRRFIRLSSILGTPFPRSVVLRIRLKIKNEAEQKA